MNFIILITQFILFTALLWKLLEFRDLKFLKTLTYLWESTKNGNRLYYELINLSAGELKNSKRIKLTSYKFFSEIVNELILSSVKFGTSITGYISEIKQALVKDIQFGKKINSNFLSGLYQIFLIFVFGLVFVFILEEQINIKFSAYDFLIPLFLQFMGLALYLLGFYLLKKQIFSPLSLYLKCFYKLRSYIYAEQSLKQIRTYIDVELLPRTKELKHFKYRIDLILKLLKETGRIDLDEFDLYINEMWQIFEIKFDQFSKAIGVVKLSILCFFSLSGYLLLVLKAFSQITFDTM